MTDMQKSKNTTALRFWLKTIIWALSFVAVTGLVLGGIMLRKIIGTSGLKLDSQPQQTQTYPHTELDKFISSILLVVQNEPLTTPNAPADMVFIVSFNALHQELTTAALASNMLLEVEGSQQTLDSLYALEGPEKLMKAINDSFDLNIMNYACTDTHSLTAMIDLLGGIETSLTADEADYINSALGNRQPTISEGTAMLSGVQCMVHALDGISGGDAFGSEARRLKLINSAIVNMRKTATKEAMLPLLAMVFSNTRSNMGLESMRGLAYEILKSEDIGIAGMILPNEGDYRHRKMGGIDVLQVDIENTRDILIKQLYALE